jgi:RNA polymerase sigma-70 factor (ECF subfamily)
MTEKWMIIFVYFISDPLIFVPMALMGSYTDKQLLELLKNSNEASFMEIYDRYGEKLFAIAYNYSKHKETAEEVVQDVFLSLWNRRNTLEIKSLSAYLATAAKFAIFARLRKEYRRKWLLTKDWAPEMAESEEAAIHARFLKEYIDQAVGALPEKCRIVYRYSRENNMTIPEIAQNMHLSPNTVENHLSRALKILRLTLKDVRSWMAIACLIFFPSHWW